MQQHVIWNIFLILQDMLEKHWPEHACDRKQVTNVKHFSNSIDSFKKRNVAFFHDKEEAVIFCDTTTSLLKHQKQRQPHCRRKIVPIHEGHGV